MNRFLVLALLLVAVLASTNAAESPVKSARDLRRAFNAALARIIDSGEFLEIKNRTGINEIIACITCTPDSSQSVYPAKDALTGRMADIVNVVARVNDDM